MPNLAEATAYLLLSPLVTNPTPLSLPEVTTKIVMMIMMKIRLKMITLVITKNKISHLLLIIIDGESIIMIMLSCLSGVLG